MYGGPVSSSMMMGGKGKGSGGIGIGNGIGSGSVGAVDAPKPAQPLPPQRDVPEWAGFGARMQRTINETTPSRISEPHGHTRAIRTMAWSCDGILLATGGEDRNVKIWEHRRRGDPTTGIPKDVFNLLTPDALLPAVGTATGTGAGEGTAALPSRPTTCDGIILHLAFAPRDPDILAVTTKASGDVTPLSSSSITTINVPTLVSSTSSDDSSKSLNATTIAAYPKLTIWNIRKRTVLATFLLPHEPQSLLFHPSGHQVAAVCMNRAKKQDVLVLIWQPELVAREDETMFECPDKEVEKSRKEGEKVWLRKLAEEGVSEKWEVRNDIGLGEPDYTVSSGDRVSEFNGATFSPCGTKLYAGNTDGALYAWEFPIKSTLSSTSASAAPDPLTAVPNGANGHYKATEMEVVDTVVDAKEGPAKESTTGEDTDSEGKRSVEPESAPPEVKAETMPETETNRMDVDTAPTAVEPSKAEVVRTTSLPYLFRKELHNGCLNCLDMDPLRRFVATGGSEGIVNLVDAEEWMTLKAFDSYTEEVRMVRFSWDGEFLATAGADRCIDIMASATGTTIHRVQTRANVLSLAWSPMRQTLCFALENHASGAAGRAGDWFYISF